MKTQCAAALFAGLTVHAYALEVPVAAGGDPHVLTAAYSPYNRVRIVAITSSSLTITFAPTERIAHLIMGDPSLIGGPKSDELANAPLKNNLFLWPLKIGQTNMQVITILPDGGERLYQYEIAVQDSRPDDENGPLGKSCIEHHNCATFGLIYAYPRDAHEAAVQRWKERKAAEDENTAANRLSVDFFYGQRNWHYVAQGKAKWLAPAEVSDNGRLTAFRWPNNMQVPAIFTMSKDATEQSQTPHMRDDLQIASTTSCWWRLRLGGGVLDIYNVRGLPAQYTQAQLNHEIKRAKDGLCDLGGYDPGTGTTSPDVVRELKSAQK